MGWITGGFDLFLNLPVFLSRNKDPYLFLENSVDDVKLIQPFCTYIAPLACARLSRSEQKN